ncbi:MAG: molybdenum ABC transporter ATP-binding protein [Rhodovibrionaceae bacterium]|nr:molybdenum ABC transporter ATP-binding protein [Rhodovibrionaceae bacterium]
MLEIDAEKRLGELAMSVQLSCRAEGVIAIFGRSGAGKTTLVNMLAGLVRPDRGRISIAGTTLFDSGNGIDLPPERRRFGYVFQEGRLFPHLTVRSNLLYGHRLAPHGERRIDLEQVVALLGLENLLRRRPHDLSGGEKQRVALGRALLANPRFLLMDEPLASLDQPRKEEILFFIEKLRDEFAVPIVYVSHAMAEVVRLADTLVLMSDGRVEATGSLEELSTRLDLRPLTGRYEAGAVLPATVLGHDDRYGLSELQVPGGTLAVPRVEEAPGEDLRLRIRARDVAISRDAPTDSSFLNVLPCRIAEIAADPGAQVDIRLEMGPSSLWARITRRSVDRLGLQQGQPVYALVKAVAIDGQSLGRRRVRQRT